MNIIDIVIILLLGLSFITGFKRGVLKELVMLLGTIIIYIISFNLKDPLGLLLCKICPFFKLGGLISLNILIYQLIAFVVIAGILFSIYSIVLKLTGILQKLVDLSIILTLPSKILGGIAGIIEGYVIIFIILLVLSIPFKDNLLFTDSTLNNKILNSSILTNTIGDLDNMIEDVYKLSNTKETNKGKNSKIIEMYLKYNIISKEDLKTIKSSGKLDK